MSERKKGLLILLLIFGPLLFLAGLLGKINQSQEYVAPIYISQKLTLVSGSNDSKRLIGELTNRTEQDITISVLNVYLSNNEKSNNLYNTLNLTNIVISANSNHQLEMDGLNRVFEIARVTKCVINGTDYKLKFSNDGIVFEADEGASSRDTIFIIIGSILLGLTVYILIDSFIIKKIKK